MKHQDCYAAHRFPPSKNCVFVYYTAMTPFCCKFFNKKYFRELKYICNKALKFYFDTQTENCAGGNVCGPIVVIVTAIPALVRTVRVTAFLSLRETVAVFVPF